MQPNTAVTRACEVIGSQRLLAEIIGVKPPSLSEWEKGESDVPVKRCVQIENATGGQVTRRDLRPNDWHLIWPELIDQDKAA